MPFDVDLKLFVRSTRSINTVDLHPTESWLLTGLSCGTVNIYSLESAGGTVIRTFKVADVHIYCVKFIARKKWFVAGSADGQLRVFNYDTYEKIIAFEPHQDWIRCLTVHPVAPVVFTGSKYGIIKAWDWDNQWRNIQTYQGHGYVIGNIAFHPIDSKTFASSGLDCAVKKWSTASPAANLTIRAHDKGVNFVEFYPDADKPYLVTAGNDTTVKIWDYISKSCVRTLEGHTHRVRFALFHPNLPIIISGGHDGVVKIWNNETYKNEHTLGFELGNAWCVTFRKDTNEVAVGFDRGVATFEINLSNKNKVHSANLRTLGVTTRSSSGGAGFPLETTVLSPANAKIMPSRSSRPAATSQSHRVRQRELNPYQQCAKLAIEIMTDKTRRKLISQLKDDKAQQMADFLSRIIDDQDIFLRLKRKHILHSLSKLAKIAQVFPHSLELEGVQCNLTHLVTAGGYGFIYKGEHEGNTICVKAVQFDLQGISRKKLRAHAGEFTLWAHLSHPNVLPFLGIYFSQEEVPRICIVSPWMNNGDLLRYLEMVPNAPRKPLVCDIVSGLQYLHDVDVIHADLKAKNVLVSETGRAMLADFGISRLSMTQTTTSTNDVVGSAYWMAPELLVEQKPSSRQSDIWAFACTCYEILTGMKPFNQYCMVPLLIGAFMRGKIVPLKPTPDIGWDEDIWLIAVRCWQGDPMSRPTIHELYEMVSEFKVPDDRSLEYKSQRRRNHVKVGYDRILSILDEIRHSPAF